MTIDLKSLSRKELEKMSRDIDKALDRLKKQDMKKAKEAAAKAAAAHGFSLSELVGGTAGPKAARKAKTKSVMKYANPADPSQQWTGKGRQPNWYKAAIEAGKSPESMAI
jgi:DNA-binding protein H-NS